MKKMGAPEDMVVYRGCGQPAGGFESLIGSDYVDHGYMSTSISKGASFGGSAKLIIKVPKGTPGIYLESISRYKSEQEFLLARSTKLRILAVRKIGSYGGVEVDAEVIV